MNAAQEQGEREHNAFDHAYDAYRKLRAFSDAMADDDPQCDAAMDAYCVAMDHLIENVRAPDIASLRIKFNLIESRCADHAGWFQTFREGFMLDLDQLEAREPRA
ncbi:hypothetical protein [Sphingomonas sp. SRS2]|uniref:hypothetical protein n=1 Tax=Sphingomonas sp. SRS2 TaxID=133190 RepID=UPI0006184900|nr:hypothetical protein [Sphingomonas sp. SRS2]KKC27317.1 hypothetical protein WP12_03995 [Sphingomonas sp. SRS2]